MTPPSARGDRGRFLSPIPAGRLFVVLLTLLAPTLSFGSHLSFDPGEIIISGPIRPGFGPDRIVLYDVRGMIEGIYEPGLDAVGQLAVDREGNLYAIANISTGSWDRIRKFDRHGHFLGDIFISAEPLGGLVVDSSGSAAYTIEGASGHMQRVIKIDLDTGQVLSTIPISAGEPIIVERIALDRDDCTFSAVRSSSDAIARFDVCAGQRLPGFEPLARDLLALNDGTLLAATSLGILRLDRRGSTIETYAANERWTALAHSAEGGFLATRQDFGSGDQIVRFRIGDPSFSENVVLDTRSELVAVSDIVTSADASGPFGLVTIPVLDPIASVALCFSLVLTALLVLRRGA